MLTRSYYIVDWLITWMVVATEPRPTGLCYQFITIHQGHLCWHLGDLNNCPYESQLDQLDKQTQNSRRNSSSHVIILIIKLHSYIYIWSYFTLKRVRKVTIWVKFHRIRVILLKMTQKSDYSSQIPVWIIRKVTIRVKFLYGSHQIRLKTQNDVRKVTIRVKFLLDHIKLESFYSKNESEKWLFESNSIELESFLLRKVTIRVKFLLDHSEKWLFESNSCWIISN
jgi:hypothetical protein